ncbi:alkaline phosphatase family protein [Clostridium sp. LP20]|uniref:alkaline phosphatase family protein n=1 Tax=Clostridium sp. LP20 TaxID=3418665 RepID=UPI003EE4B8CB
MLGKNFILPDYNGRNFINVINSIKEIYGINEGQGIRDKKALKLINNPSKVVFILVDAFGWDFYEKVRKNSSFLKKIKRNGAETKITSQFPSTTTAHVTSVATGESVGKHGFFEWFTYDPELDEVFTPFIYNYEGVENILPKESLFRKLQDKGVRSTIISPSYINNSSYSRIMFKDGKVKGYDSVDEMFEILINSLSKDKGKNFYYLYYPNIDSSGHQYGMSSYQAQGEISKFIKTLDKYFNSETINEIKDTLFIMTADHGQMEIDMDRVVYINELVPDIDKYMILKSDGRPIVPVGYNRDMFLYIKEENLKEIKKILEEKLKGKAEVYLTKELIELGLFGEISEELSKRVGNLIILSYDKIGVWWYDRGISEISQKGSHGGLTRKEMEIPLLMYNFDK